MAKPSTRILSIALIAALFAAAVVSARQGTASVPKRDSNTVKTTEQVLSTISRLRGLEVKRPVTSSPKTRDEIESVVVKKLEESASRAEFEASQKTLTLLGLVPPGFRLYDSIVALLREQVAGLYEPKTGEFYVAAWLPLAEQDGVIAHELMHALQDQHFNLRRFENWPKGDSDAELAAHSVIEGEATVVMLQYGFQQEGVRADVLKISNLTELLRGQISAVDASKFPALAAAPLVLRESLQFPYVYGAGFVQAVLKAGSWQALNNTYQRMPQSTEQIIHPAKFFSRDDPVTVQIDDLTPALGSDWKRLESDVNGEFGLFLVLSEFLTKARATTAAAGWGGDRYVLYEDRQANELILAQYTTWDTVQDAIEFFDAYSQRTLKRYGSPRWFERTAGWRVYHTSHGLTSLERRGSDVLILEGARDLEQIGRLADLLWKSKKARRLSAAAH